MELGYRKLPKDKPPLLNKEEIDEAHAQGVYECMDLNKHKGSTPRIEARKAIAQAQREADIKHYEEVSNNIC